MKRETRTIFCVVATDTKNPNHVPIFSVRLYLHIHEQPFLACQLFALAELVERCEAEADPAEVLGYVGQSGLVDVAVDAQDETIAGEVVDFAEFEEGHETVGR